jgi:hypothetical protein
MSDALTRLFLLLKLCRRASLPKQLLPKSNDKGTFWFYELIINYTKGLEYFSGENREFFKGTRNSTSSFTVRRKISIC